MALLPLAFTVAVLAMMWTYTAPMIGVPTWPVFIVWAIYFIAGANTSAFIKGGAPLVSGAVLAWLAVQVASSESVGMPIAIGVIAFVMVMMSNIRVFALIPAQFVGAAIFFGTGLDLKDTLVCMPIGLVLGFVSATIPELLMHKWKKRSRATNT